jgi:hypothetical protein
MYLELTVMGPQSSGSKMTDYGIFELVHSYLGLVILDHGV